jgi:transposase-like protein
MIQEAYVNGVSTRKIERLAKELGIENISASQVSQITKGLDEQTKEFRNRPLQKEYPFFVSLRSHHCKQKYGSMLYMRRLEIMSAKLSRQPL